MFRLAGVECVVSASLSLIRIALDVVLDGALGLDPHGTAYFRIGSTTGP
ncbi:MAG: hypothetical protein NTZ04_01885 [Chloroflexi bacterium]|nr:hypothetical protein [Chloroflexota bacterium]